ncbi:Rne/Rng family ribonuclease [Amycolatopsis minnesotensis]|uniref:Translation initiation factor IF-2 N-terminal domain-containing protein n=1 Tax=Amycolatopsis minnesotensis TaxID=337894 RepID=A0ABN2QGK7_9PSEU
MSNADTPAENTGGNTATPLSPGAAALGELPARIRVHALAKLLGSHSRDVLAKLTELGETARSAQSSVPKEVALRVADALVGPAETTEAPKSAEAAAPVAEQVPEEKPAPEPEPAKRPAAHVPVFAAPSPVFLPPEPSTRQERPAEQAKPAKVDDEADEIESDDTGDNADGGDGGDGGDYGDDDGSGRRRRRRGRRGRGRGKGGEDSAENEADDEQDTGAKPAKKKDKAESEKNTEQKKADSAKDEQAKDSRDAGPDADSDEDGDGGSRRRRRRRRRKGGDESDGDGAQQTGDDPPNTVVHVRDGKGEGKPEKEGKAGGDGVRSVRGSTRLEAKRQRRRDGREAGRRRAPILSESEFLARREAVERTMVVAEKGESTQIGVLEDGVLVEHFVTSSGSGSIVGNVYLGRVQNVLPSMEAAFVDIGRGRNAVLYAGEVDWDAAGLEGKSRKIEQALSTGDSVLVQVTKDPVGHKGARLTTQISLPGRFLVYVPAGGATGISRKLPENERRRLKDILKRIVPEDAGVIIRTASEGVSEEELDRDVRRLKAQWDVIKTKADENAGQKKSSAPTMLYEEPDLLVKVVRDLFTEDFAKLEVQGGTAWDTIHGYVQHVAPDLAERLKRYVGNGDVFTDYRIDEQITKALDRKVWLPSGGYLVIDRTEAMTVIDVNTGKFTGSGGNLEETVTRNNLESAEEIVRQLRLRDIGGIIVIDFIDMVLESNRELVLRRLTECLGRDRTRHQVAEVTSLGLVQMTRKRVGTGLLEAFSTSCEHCKGRGVVISTDLSRVSGSSNGGHQHSGGNGHGKGRSRGRGKGDDGGGGGGGHTEPARTEQAADPRTPEQRESVVSAVQAMANASKAVASKDEDETEPEQARKPELNGHAPEPTGRTRRARRRGGRGGEQQENAAPEAPEVSQAPETPVPAPEKAAEPPAGTDESVAPVAAETPVPAEEDEAAPEGSVPAPAVRSARRRPRRAASRPAGPPVNASEKS